LNIQTEHLENNIARLTVEIDAERLEKAKQSTVRNLSKRVNIPGFRKGKAPYNMVVRYLGEPTILEETMETLGQEVYRESLDQSGLQPYGPGQLEDFKLDPLPTFIYTLPLQPKVDLGAYREVRRDYASPEVTDEMVNKEIELLQEQEALIEESQRPVAVDNRVTIDIHSYFVDENDDETMFEELSPEEAQAPADATVEAVQEETDAEFEDDEEDYDPLHDHDDDHEPYIHQHNLVIRLRQGDDEPIGPGFTAALIGANVNEVREFEITYPTTENVNPDIAGRTVKFIVEIKKIETMTLPPINDEFAARFTERFAKPAPETSLETTAQPQPLSLLELRIRLRELLAEDAEAAALNEYANAVLDNMVSGATIAFPEEMVEDQIDDIMANVESRLNQQGLSMEIFRMVTGKTEDTLRADYRTQAVGLLERSLVLGEVMMSEQISVTDAEVDAELESIAAQFGEQASTVMRSLRTQTMLSSIVNRMLQEKTMERIGQIGRGLAPELPASPAEITPEIQEEVAASEEGQGEA
jgi:trigger factor